MNKTVIPDSQGVHAGALLEGEGGEVSHALFRKLEKMP